jgi:nicotinate phosphoribosyltransferase
LIPPRENKGGALLTDLYQLTMNAAYLDSGKADELASFEMFIRGLPVDWGYFVAAGIDEAIDYVCRLRFSDDDVSYLQGLNIFKDEYLDYLTHFRFEGEIAAVREGTPFTSESPIFRVSAKRPQAQLVETAILNIINSQTLIASKASRVVNAAGSSKVIDFGLRRAQGFDAGIKGARSSYIAGAVATSDVEAAKIYGIHPSGTMAHSFVMGFDDECEAFRAYARSFPDSSIFLVDTYDTLEGTRMAAVVAKEMEGMGLRLQAIRLDSGNLEGLSRKIREILDSEGLQYVKIVVSSDLNEYKIDEFTRSIAPVDFYGVGTEMITAKPVAALSGVYKLVEDCYGPRIKLSDSKRTYPGVHQLSRVEDSNGVYHHDVLELLDEDPSGIPLLEPAARGGVRVRIVPLLDETRDHCLDCVSKLPERVRRVRVMEPYELRISEGLQRLADEVSKRYGRR